MGRIVGEMARMSASSRVCVIEPRWSQTKDYTNDMFASSQLSM